MKSHCCKGYDRSTSVCFAPNSDYNYEDVDCDCECERCSASADARICMECERYVGAHAENCSKFNMSEADNDMKDQKPKFKTDTFASYYNEVKMTEASVRDDVTGEMRWDHTGDNEDEPKLKSFEDYELEDDVVEPLSDEEHDKYSDAQWARREELMSKDERFDEADETDVKKPEFGLEFDPNFDQDPDELFSYGKANEGVNFDKFIDKILISEGHGRQPTKPEDNPQRRRAMMRQDRPANRTVYRRTK